MMSIFSSFDAFYAESFGQKAKFSTGQKDNDVNHVDYTRTTKKDGDERKTPASKSQQAQAREQTKRLPRFAPELDGVHCFETIVPC
ncbi:Avr9/Cf-9 rapidly elicited protein [Melia azedarach]|uniref:Avr9/Cf-9 rapidly elicited protein n=1 Tax=Melia azedarach TaxID=155640 RepID=A0ACC1YT99_MELAZ|nr:Avr9/Cf-9 rapidly elicited protein [Melia azedarach]